MAKVLSRIDNKDDEYTKGWARFVINVGMIYKKSQDSEIHKGTVPLLVPIPGLECRCPKIKADK